SKLIIENNKNEHTLSILEEIEKIENYIEQVLYYSKSNELEKDYIVKEISLRQCVNNTIRRNKKAIRDKDISIDIQDFNKNVYCDNKWVEFILNQIIINSVKYIGNKSINKKLYRANGKIKIYIEEHSNSTELFIEDNGIGIDEKDLRKVFEKGFTGLNGRKLKKSTGMGLYISKKLADKMSLGISIDSKINEYTVVKITFPENNMMKIINN
ncbi:MAG: ATP-binding protein, partial [Paraclostridium sp.]